MSIIKKDIIQMNVYKKSLKTSFNHKKPYFYNFSRYKSFICYKKSLMNLVCLLFDLDWPITNLSSY